MLSSKSTLSFQLVSKFGLLPPFSWLLQSILLNTNHNSEHTTLCTILEALVVSTARGVVMRWEYQLGTSHDHTPCHQKDSVSAKCGVVLLIRNDQVRDQI